MKRLNDTINAYGCITIAVHWLCALGIISVFVLGIYMVELDYANPWYHQAPAVHISVGLCILIAMVFRLAWRLISKTPHHLPSHGRLTRITAFMVKVCLYVLVFCILISGYLVTSSKGQGPSLFGWTDFPVFIQLSANQVDGAGWIHECLSWVLMLMVVVHASGAILHHCYHQDNTLSRMLNPSKE